jgi:hypothetical protein
MLTKFRWLLWICGIILIANFGILMAYGYTLRSTHLFIVRSTVFYPVAYLNLILGVALIAALILDLIKRK